ncbi:MAG: patatin-like phospholipase family protein, partial [Lacisediminimonas sp.]|nr:patatin-like phospholipase family protein [Lacisediminimonas sp.]
LVISPSLRLDDIAARHVHHLPRPVRVLLAGVGGTEVRGAALASYLLFEESYTRELVALGMHDTMAKREEVIAFFALGHVGQAARRAGA